MKAGKRARFTDYKGVKAAVYARVSTEDQHNDMQLTDLRDYVRAMHWEAVEYIEKESSVKRRPVFDAMMEDARRRKFDVVLVWKVDRFARRMKDVIDVVLELDKVNVRFMSLTQKQIDSDQKDPMGRFLLHLFAALAELERGMIVERTKAGLAEYQRAYAAGKVGKARHSKSGKDLAIGRPRRVFRRDQAVELRKQGLSWRAIGRKLGVSFMTVRNVVLGSKPGVN